MNMHKNARLTPRGRERIVRQVASGQTPEAVAEAAGICPRTVRKWVDRHRREGLAGLQDRSSRPHRLHRPTPQAVVVEIERLRRQRWTGKQIASETGVSPATVSRVLRRLGLNSSVPWSRPNRYGVMNASIRASSSISISKSSAESALWATASPGDILARSTVTTASVGSSSMSASTMPRGSRLCRCWPISAGECGRLP